MPAINFLPNKHAFKSRKMSVVGDCGETLSAKSNSSRTITIHVIYLTISKRYFRFVFSFCAVNMNHRQNCTKNPRDIGFK